MKRDGKYRFTLQFPADTERRIRAGELLEQLGNRKSAVVVAALCEYADVHPELLTRPVRAKIQTEYAASRAALEELVRKLVSEQLEQGGAVVEQNNAYTFDDDIARMLGNLDVFG